MNLSLRRQVARWRRARNSAPRPSSSSGRPVVPPPPPPPPPPDSARVVDVNVPATPPMVRVVVLAVLNCPDDVCLTHTVSPSLIVPGAFVNVAVQPIEY